MINCRPGFVELKAWLDQPLSTRGRQNMPQPPSCVIDTRYIVYYLKLRSLNSAEDVALIRDSSLLRIVSYAQLPLIFIDY